MKVPTQWITNTNAAASLRSYDSGATAYDSSSLKYAGYSGSTFTTKTPTAWSKTGKTATAWSRNSAAAANQRVYDSGSTVYNSGALTYDGNVSGQSSLNTKVPTKWSST